MRIKTSILLVGIVGIAAIPSLGDTLSFNDHGSVINGTVTFSDGLFRLRGQFDGKVQEIEIAPHRVGAIQFNGVDDNPNLARDLHDHPDPKVVRVDVKFWDSSSKELDHVLLEEVSSDSIKVGGKAIKRSDIRQMKVAGD